MSALAGPFAAVCALLVVGGLAKLGRPRPAVAALDGVGWRLPAAIVRVGATGEVVLGTGALWTGRASLAALVALAYLGFAAFIVRARRVSAIRGTAGSCGCFGQPDVPPSVAHVVLNLAAAATSIAVTARQAHGVAVGAAVAWRSPWHGAPFVLLVGVTTWLAFLALGRHGLPGRHAED